MEFSNFHSHDLQPVKHGMKLAAISGVNGPFSDADINRVRKLALAARAKQAAAARKPRGAKQSAARRRKGGPATKTA